MEVAWGRNDHSEFVAICPQGFQDNAVAVVMQLPEAWATVQLVLEAIADLTDGVPHHEAKTMAAAIQGLGLSEVRDVEGERD